MEALIKQVIQLSALLRKSQKAYYNYWGDKVTKQQLLKRAKALESRLDAVLFEIFKASPELQPKETKIDNSQSPIDEWLAR